MTIQTYLQFEGRCEEALNFYKDAIGAEVQMIMRHSEAPQPAPAGILPEGSGEKIMHAAFQVGDSVLLATDGRCTGQPSFQGFSLNIAALDADEAQRIFGRLSQGGKVTMPLQKTFWAPSFGTLVDKFGISWMVMVPAAVP